MADTKAAHEPKAQVAADPVESEVYVPTDALATDGTDDDGARDTFIANHKGKIDVDSVQLVTKQHDIGNGVTYVFRADPK